MVVKNVEKKEKNVITFQVEVSPEEFEEALSRAYLKNRKNIFVQGFRKGKAPRMVIEGMYGADAFYSDAIDEMTPKAFEFGVKEQELKTVGRPSCTDAEVGDEKQLVLSYEAAIYPEVTLGAYLGLETPKQDSAVTDEDVDKFIADIRTRNGRQVSVERPAALGDKTDIDFEGTLDGVPFEGGKAEGHKLELGSGSFIPGFEDGVVGMSVGEEKDIGVTFPEEYHSEELAGKAVVFHVKLNEVFETELPELDDEFAKDVSEFDTLAEYRSDIMRELTEKKLKAVGEDFASAAIEEAIKNMTLELPEAMIEERITALVSDYGRALSAQGIRLEDYMRMTGTDPEGLSNMMRPQAEIQLKGELLLEAVVKAENIEVGQEELDKAAAELAESYNMTTEELLAAVPQDAISDDIKRKKAHDLIVASAVPVAPSEPQEIEN
jgi:trigger factor